MESIYDEQKFVSTKCDSYMQYEADECSYNRTITIGGDLTLKDSGKYYLKTDPQPPKYTE